LRLGALKNKGRLASSFPPGAILTPGSPKTLFTIQALRAIAAAAVVSYHVLFMLVHSAGYAFNVTTIGGTGVDLFFLISGFIMIYTNFDAFGRPGAPASFMRRRVIRVVPLYWVCTTLVVLLLAFAPRLFSSVKFEWTYVISSYLFLLSVNSAGDVGTVIQTGWTLCYEFYFYALFALLLYWPRKYFLAASGAIFAAGVILAKFSGPLPVWATVATNPILFEFYLGALIAFLFIRGVSLPRSLAAATIIVAIAVLVLTENAESGLWTRFLYWGLPAGAVLFGAISLERAGIKTPKLLVSLGYSSYSLYLIHPFVLPAFGKSWTAMHLSEKISPVFPGLLAFACALLAGHVVYLFFEKPLIGYLSRAWKGHRPPYEEHLEESVAP
jgi:peptidoglycan/LPS O-acetylase OafA/YrhL